MTSIQVKNIVISGTNMWNPGDDFVRDGVIRILRRLFAGFQLNFLFYNFNQDFFPQSKFSGIANTASKGDLDRYRDSIDAIVIAGLSAGNEIKDLYNWVIQNRLHDRVYLIGAGYENAYVERYISEEPEATIFKNARIIIGRTAKTPRFIPELNLPYHHINCPAILSVPAVKHIAPGKTISRIGFSLQLPHEQGIPNQSCSKNMYDLGMQILLSLKTGYELEVIAHHKSEYFHFINLLKEHNIPVIFSSFYHDLFNVYPRYDLLVTTRLHASLFANGFGIPGIIINDTDRHTHCLEGFPHSVWVGSFDAFNKEFNKITRADLRRIAEEADSFKANLLNGYLDILREPFGISSSTEYDYSLKPNTTALLSSLGSSEVKQRVLEILSRLSTDVYLNRNIETFQTAIRNRETWFDSVTFLNWYAATFKPDAYLEVGVRRGRSMAQVVVASPGTRCFGFDMWIPNYAGVDNPGPEFVLNELRKLGGLHAPLLVKGDSHETLPRFWADPDNPQQIDLIYVDGDHTYEGAKKDLDITFAHLSPGGALLFDDISHPSHPELYPLWEEYKHRFPDYLFIEDRSGNGTACAFKPPFTRLEKFLQDATKSSVSSLRLGTAPFSEKDIQETKTTSGGTPVHFFTIVLNGEPFIRRHIDVFSRLPFKWRWHIIEGVADLKHDTSWSVRLGGKITDKLHRNGLSNDGTTEYLDELARRFPENIIVYRKPSGRFWDGKLEMVNAPLVNINEPCLLWQVDVDEYWTPEQICTAHSMFEDRPEKSAAYYFCNFFVGPELIITTRNTYGNHTDYEWLRTWRYNPGDRWTTHEPPRLCRRDKAGEWTDLAKINPFMHPETESNGLVFNHYAYVTEQQLLFKEIYYGYANALSSWRSLQAAKNFPVRLKDYFPWVKDEALVDRSDFKTAPPPDQMNIIYLRPDSIGDNILASSMLPYIHEHFKGPNITVLCQEHIAELYKACPYVSNIITFNRVKALKDEVYRNDIIRSMRESNADILLNSVYSRDTITDFLALNSGAKKTVAFEGDLSNMTADQRKKHNALYSTVIKSDEANKSETERSRDFLQGIHINAQKFETDIWITPEDNDFADKFFKDNNLDPAKTICLFAGAQYDVRIYEGYGTALSEICREQGFSVIGLGSATDWDINKQNLEAIGVRTINISGKTALLQTASILSRCRLAVGAETGLAHMACAAGVPNIILLGGGHFGRFMPYSSLTSIVCLPLDCFYCNWKCRYDRAHCVKDIDPEVIAQAIRQTLEEPRERARVFVQGSSLWEQKQGYPRWQSFHNYLDMAEVAIITIGEIDPYISDTWEKLKTRDKTAQAMFLKEAVAELIDHGEELFADNDLKGAESSFLRALALEGDSAEALNNLGVMNLRIGNRENAAQYLEEAVKIQPDNTMFLKNLADCYLLEPGRSDDAIRIYSRVLEGNPDDLDALLNLGRISKALKDYVSAKNFFNRIIELEPENKDAKEELASLKGLAEQAPTPSAKVLTDKNGSILPKISVVTPSYNQARFIDQTIKSILAQNYKHFEHIVMDGGSDDGTIEILKKYPHLIWRSEKDKGQSDALNKALHMTTGDIIAWINSDDWYEPDVFPVIAQWFMENPDKNIVMGDCNLIDEKGRIFDKIINTARGFNELKQYRVSQSIPTQPAIFFRKRLLDEFGYPDVNLHYAMDYDLWMKFSQKNYLHHLDITIANYRFHAGAKGGDQDWSKFVPEWKEVHDRYVPKSDNRPLVSVIVTCFNYGRYLKEAVESVVKQTYQNIEVIIVNDGSTDNTKEIAEGLISGYPSYDIRLINQENSGQPAISRNNGIASSRGDYILCLDADDCLAPTMIAECMHVLNSNSRIAIAYTDRQDFDGADQIVPAGDYDFAKLRHANQISYCALYKKEIWDRVRGYRTNVKGLEDWDFWIAAGARGYTGKRIPKPLLLYRRHDTGVFQEAIANFRDKFAQIILNNREAYSSSDVSKAQYTLANKDRASKANYPLVSVIIPTFNRPDMLRDAINSVLKQTLQDLEIIVVNDAGEDVSGIIHSFNDNRIKLIRHPVNRGLASARTTGIKNASGQYIALLDDDDIFYPDHLETAVGELGETQRVVYTDAVRATYQKKGDGYELADKKTPYSMDYDRNKLLLGNIAPVNCFVFDRTLAIKAGLFDETLSTLEDWDFWIRLSALAPFKHINKPTVQVNWRTDGTTMTSSRQAEFHKNRKAIYDRNMAEINRIPNAKEIMAEFQAIWSGDERKSVPEVTVNTETNKGIVSIIILTFNQLEYTKKCVQGLRRHTPQPHEIIFVDNGSTDGTRKYLQKLVKANENYQLILNEKNLGFAGGNNQGIARAKGDYIILLNNDVLVTKDWLERMISHLERHPDTGMVGPMSNSASGPQLVDKVPYGKDMKAMPRFARDYTAENIGKTSEVLRLVGFCLLIKKDVIDIIGGLDENYGSGNFEDDDLCLRSALAGYKNIIAQDVFVHHYGSMTFKGNSIDYMASMEGNRQRFADKWKGIVEFVGDKYNVHVTKEQRLTKLLEWGEERFSRGDAGNAVKIFERILMLDPSNSQALNNLGVIQWQTGETVSAMKTFQTALNLNPKDADAMANLKMLENAVERSILINEKERRIISEWEHNGRPVPPPHIVKQVILKKFAERYNLRIFIETGTFYGDMVEAMKGFFDRIFSIELSRELYEKVRERFKGKGHIKLIHGDSGKELEGVLKSINEPALFWLDGHYSAGETARGEKDTPIYEELQHILTSREKRHVIIIDDARCFGSEPDYPTIQSLKEFINSIRPDMEISVQDDSIRIVPK